MFILIYFDFFLFFLSQTPGNWTDVIVTVKGLNGGTLGNGACPDYRESRVYNISFHPILPEDRRTVTIDNQLCFQQGESYEIKFNFQKSDGLNDGTTNID